MAVFVRERGSNTWHWRKDCSQYPQAVNITIMTPQRPIQGLLCNECQNKEEKEERIVIKTSKEI
jgi:hypothetical protein